LDGGRTAVLADIEKVAKRYADLKSTNAAPLVRNVQLAHDQIIDYLNSNQKKRSKEEFATLLDSDLRQFETEARWVAESASRIENGFRRQGGAYE
jgi:hypothetical protein